MKNLILLFSFCVLVFFLFLSGVESRLSYNSRQLSAGRPAYRGGCPKGVNGQFWLFHNVTSKCYIADTQGPCEDTLIFYQDPDNRKNGVCDCDDQISEIVSRNAPEYCGRKRAKIYYPQTNRCYSAFHQGPCPTNQWLILSRTLKPICIMNPCPASKNDDPESLDYYFSNYGYNTCYRTFTYGFCTNKKFLIPNENDVKPTCSSKPNKLFKTTGKYDSTLKINCPHIFLPSQKSPKRLKCRAGSRREVLGICQNRRFYY